MAKFVVKNLSRAKVREQGKLKLIDAHVLVNRKRIQPDRILFIAGNYTRVVKACDSKCGVCDLMDIGLITVPEPEAQTQITGEVVTEIMKQEGMLTMNQTLRSIHTYHLLGVNYCVSLSIQAIAENGYITLY